MENSRTLWKSVAYAKNPSWIEFFAPLENRTTLLVSVAWFVARVWMEFRLRLTQPTGCIVLKTFIST